jgi:hypothetical protein
VGGAAGQIKQANQQTNKEQVASGKLQMARAWNWATGGLVGLRLRLVEAGLKACSYILTAGSLFVCWFVCLPGPMPYAVSRLGEDQGCVVAAEAD